jgi:hypothetical protein
MMNNMSIRDLLSNALNILRFILATMVIISVDLHEVFPEVSPVVFLMLASSSIIILPYLVLDIVKMAVEHIVLATEPVFAGVQILVNMLVQMSLTTCFIATLIFFLASIGSQDSTSSNNHQTEYPLLQEFEEAVSYSPNSEPTSPSQESSGNQRNSATSTPLKHFAGSWFGSLVTLLSIPSPSGQGSSKGKGSDDEDTTDINMKSKEAEFENEYNDAESEATDGSDWSCEEEMNRHYESDVFHHTKIGSFLKGKYLVLAKIGAGSFASAWVCKDIE